MNSCPREPGEYPAQPDSTCLKDRETGSDNGHIPFIEIAERLGGGRTKQTLGDSTTRIAALLNRHLGDNYDFLHSTPHLVNRKSRLPCGELCTAIPRGDSRPDHGSYISVFEHQALPLLRFSKHDIHHCPGQVVGSNDLVRK